MPKIPYKTDKNNEDDEDYEIVSFEDFCDKSGGSKTDLLTLNDNINYRLCYESDKGPSLNYDGETSSRDENAQTETSLSAGKNVAFKRKTSGTFAPFGKYNGKPQKGSLFGGVIPKPRVDAEASGSREQHRRWFWNFPDRSRGTHSTLGWLACCLRKSNVIEPITVKKKEPQRKPNNYNNET